MNLIEQHKQSESALITELVEADTLAAIIRKVDGNHTLGAGTLAERIIAEIEVTK